MKLKKLIAGFFWMTKRWWNERPSLRRCAHCGSRVFVPRSVDCGIVCSRECEEIMDMNNYDDFPF